MSRGFYAKYIRQTPTLGEVVPYNVVRQALYDIPEVQIFLTDA